MHFIQLRATYTTYHHQCCPIHKDIEEELLRAVLVHKLLVVSIHPCPVSMPGFLCTQNSIAAVFISGLLIWLFSFFPLFFVFCSLLCSFLTFGFYIPFILPCFEIPWQLINEEDKWYERDCGKLGIKAGRLGMPEWITCSKSPGKITDPIDTDPVLVWTIPYQGKGRVNDL